MITRSTLALLLFLPLVMPACSRRAEPPPEADVLARVGSREIRVAELRERLERRAVANGPSDKEALLDELIEFGAQVERARELGLDQDPGLRRAWENLLVARLRETQFEPLLTNAVPSAAQVQARYEANRTAYTEPARRQGAILFLQTSPKTSAERRIEVRRRLEEARSKSIALATNEPMTRGFGPLAIEYSEHQATRYRGGDIGWVEAGRGDTRFDAAVLDALFRLPAAGSTSEILETPQGYYLVKLVALRPERVKPFDEVRPAIEHTLLLENRRRIEADWKRSIMAGQRIERFPEGLARFPAPPPASPAASPAPPPLP